MIKTEEEYLQLAMKSYDNSTSLTVEEFNNDLIQYISIKKNIRKYFNDRDLLRKIINQVVIYYNCFNHGATELLLFKIREEEILAVLIPIIIYLGRSIDYMDTLNITINVETIKELQKI